MKMSLCSLYSIFKYGYEKYMLHFLNNKFLMILIKFNLI